MLLHIEEYGISGCFNQPPKQQLPAVQILAAHATKKLFEP